jgi:hypothetical protein
MNTSKPSYTRLRTPRLGWLRFSRVYLAADHLLLVDCSGFEERYRRILLADIEAIVIRRTISGGLMSLGLGFFGTSFLLVAWALGSGGLVIFGVLGAVLLISLLFNILRGPTCSVSLKTRVQLHQVKAFSRLVASRRCVEQLLPLIQRAQAVPSSAPASDPASTAVDLASDARPSSSLAAPSGEPTPPSA